MGSVIVGRYYWVSCQDETAIVVAVTIDGYARVRFADGTELTVPPSWLTDVCQDCLMPNCDCA